MPPVISHTSPMLKSSGYLDCVYPFWLAYRSLQLRCFGAFQWQSYSVFFCIWAFHRWPASNSLNGKLLPINCICWFFFHNIDRWISNCFSFAWLIRLALFFMPVKYHPPEPYVRRVQAWKMHVFTLVQVFALVVLWTVKSSQFSLAFPFFLIMMVPLRQRLTMIFSPREMNAVSKTYTHAVLYRGRMFWNYNVIEKKLGSLAITICPKKL